MSSIFLGHTFEYWLELQQIAVKDFKVDLIDEIAILRSKVSFYESRIQELSDFMTHNLEIKGE